MAYIYILKLEQNKWYVGYSKHPEKRIHKHINSNSKANWIKLYPVLQVEAIIKGTREKENEVTIAYMSKYGIDNVRGGDWSQPKMTKTPPKLFEYIDYP